MAIELATTAAIEMAFPPPPHGSFHHRWCEWGASRNSWFRGQKVTFPWSDSRGLRRTGGVAKLVIPYSYKSPFHLYFKHSENGCLCFFFLRSFWRSIMEQIQDGSLIVVATMITTFTYNIANSAPMHVGAQYHPLQMIQTLRIWCYCTV